MNENIRDLKDLIHHYGPPDALVDNYSLKSGYAIWGFEQSFYFSKNDFFYNNTKEDCNPFDRAQTLLDFWIRDVSDIKAIGFLSYDIKNIIYPHILFKTPKTDFPYMWFGKPKKIRKYSIESDCSTPNKKFLYPIRNIETLSNYKNIIKKIKKELSAGNTYQINLTMEKIFEIDATPLDIYLSIRQYAKPQYGYYLNIGSEQILSFSPEQFFHTKGKSIYTYPMKGTIARGQNNSEDKIMKQKLKDSKKDKAEHIMIVDLLRNDLGKICEYGSIDVQELFSIRDYPTVYQMVSCIYGELRGKISYIDIFKALCPGGSITGAPKESSMKIIDLLENYNRGMYTGNIGYIDYNSDMHFNMAIRTMIIKKHIAQYCVGGGIVWDSRAEEEWHEAQLKSKILDKFIRG